MKTTKENTLINFLGSRITSAREALGIKPTELSRLTGIDRQKISHYETGRSKHTSAEAIFALARVLKVSPYWLATGEGDRTDTTSSGLDDAAFLEAYNLHVNTILVGDLNLPVETQAAVLKAMYLAICNGDNPAAAMAKVLAAPSL